MFRGSSAPHTDQRSPLVAAGARGPGDRAEEPVGAATRLALLDAAVREAGETVLITTADLDPPGPHIVFVNPAASRLTGYAPEELVGRTPRMLQGPKTDRATLDQLRAHLTRGEPFAGHLVNYRKDGTEYVVDWQIAPVRDAGARAADPEVAGAEAAGPITHFVAVQRDITARVQAEVERERLLADARRARADAETASRARGDFLAMMSHELRTPLQAIGGTAELMERGIYGEPTDAQHRALARIRESQRHLLGLINEILSYSRLGRGTVTYRLTDVRVADAVAAAESVVLPQLRAKGLGYAWAGCAADGRVRADADKLQRILVNLLANAVKFTDARGPSSGRVAVSCESRAAGEHHPALMCIQVRDTGEGIAADKLEAIFEPFVQVGRALDRPGEGTGLGLAISRDLARGMDGDLTVESTPGAGSTFTLTLPAA